MAWKLWVRYAVACGCGFAAMVLAGLVLFPPDDLLGYLAIIPYGALCGLLACGLFFAWEAVRAGKSRWLASLTAAIALFILTWLGMGLVVGALALRGISPGIYRGEGGTTWALLTAGLAALAGFAVVFAAIHSRIARPAP